MNFGFYRDLSTRHGAARVLAHGAYRAIGRLTGLTVWNMMAAELDQIERSNSGAGAEAQQLEASEVAPYARLPENSALADDAFLIAASRGDRCFGFLEGDLLAHFGWYSIRPTVVFDMGTRFVLHFDSRAWVYVHNCFTHPAHRGRKLHGRATLSAARALRREGYRGLLARVAWNNFASLKSFERMGFRTVGYVVRVDGRPPLLTPGCRPYGLRFAEPTAAGENAHGKSPQNPL